MSLVAPVKDGKIEQYTSSSTEKEKKVGTSELGKDAFLQLLVAQMKYQDPLNPSSDTEWISQMAQFSALEQMQNLNTTMSNAQAFSYIGQNVVINTKSDSGDIKEVYGKVDYATISNNKAYVSVNGKLYLATEVSAVLDSSYLNTLNAPSISEQEYTFDYDDPKDIQISLSMGKEDAAATGFAVALNGSLIESKYLSYDEDKGILTIDKDAFTGLTSGSSYKLQFAFDDAAQTMITDKVTIAVKGTQPEIPQDETTEDVSM